MVVVLKCNAVDSQKVDGRISTVFSSGCLFWKTYFVFFTPPAPLDGENEMRITIDSKLSLSPAAAFRIFTL